MLKHILQIVLFVLLPTFVTAQNFTRITGSVTDEQQEPLIGVSIQHLPSKKGTVTNEKGNFALEVPADLSGTIVVKHVGFATQTIDLKQTQGIRIVLKASEQQLNQVVVSAGKYQQEVKRLTVSTDIIKPYLIENKATVNMEGILNQLPSVNVVDGQANIRGGSGWSYGAGSRVLITLDDMPFLSGDAGSAQWKFLPVENLEQVEVIKGASSVLYGSSALNGIINIRTADPKSKPRSKFQLTTGVYDQLPRDSSRWHKGYRFQTGFNGFHAQRFGRLDATIMMNYLNDQGYRLGEDDSRFRTSIKTNYRNSKIAGLQYGINASIMQQRSTSFLIWEDFAYGYTALDSSTTETKSLLWSVDPHLDFYTRGVKHKIRTRINAADNRINAANAGQNQDNRFLTYFGEYQVQKALNANKGMVIGGLMGSYTESNSPLYNGIHTLRNIAPYLQVDYQINKWSFSAGTRYEHFSMDGKSEDATIFRTGVNYGLTSSTFLRSSFGQGFRFPSIAEKYITTSVGLINVFPNPYLEAERGWSAEFAIKQGIRIAKWNGYIDVAYFHTEYQNMIEFNFGVWDNFLTSTNPIGFKAFNVGQTRINGLDVTLAGEGKILGITTRTLIGYTYTKPMSIDPDYVFSTDSFNTKSSYRSTSEDSSNLFLKYRYQHLFKADVEFEWKKFTLGYSLRYNSYMTNVDKAFLQPIFIPGIDRGRALNPNGDWISDMRVGYNASKRIKFQLLVNNMFNHEQMTRPADMRPPRMFLIQIQYALQ